MPAVEATQRIIIEEKDNGSKSGGFFQEFFVEILAGGAISIIGYIIGKVRTKKSIETKLNMTKN